MDSSNLPSSRQESANYRFRCVGIDASAGIAVHHGLSWPLRISYRGVKPARVSAALVRCGLRRETDLPQVSSCDQM